MTGNGILTTDIQDRRQQKAHFLLDWLLREAETSAMYGRVGVEAIVENGKITVLRRVCEATEK